jgi:hypothetical protein
MQNLIESELAEMPSCNLAEIKDNAWLQESGNRGNDLYIANVDDFIRALIQVSRYYQFLKGEYAGNRSREGRIDATGCPTFGTTVRKPQGIKRCYGKDAQSIGILHLGATL